jgi:hypothetical protein
MRMLFIASLVAALSQPDASSWTRLFQDASESTYVIPSPRSRDRAERIFWLRHVFPKVRPKGVKYSEDQWQVNCASGTYTMLAVVEYDARGKVLSAQAVRTSARIPARVEPGSRMDKVFRTVCE